MLLTPLGILRILNLICACPGVGAGMRESSILLLKVMLFVSIGLCFWTLCYQVVVTGINKYCVLSFISGGSKEPAKHRDEWEVTGNGGPCSY